MGHFFLQILVLFGAVRAFPDPRPFKGHKARWRPHQRQEPAPSVPLTTQALPPTTTALRTNIWHELRNDDAAGVIAFLHNQTELNLTSVDDAGPWDNTIMVVDLLPPNKTDALAYMDGQGSQPQRWAIASVLFGATEMPYVQDLAVGPLPVGAGTEYHPYTFGTHALEAKIRVYTMDSPYDLLVDYLMQMTDILTDLLHFTISSREDFENNFSVWGIDPLWHEADFNGQDHVIYWAGVWRESPKVKADGGYIRWDAETLLPQGIYLQADITGRDQAKWAVKGVLYGDEYYTSVEAFRTAWRSKGFVKYTPNEPGDWLGTDPTGSRLPFETRPPPMAIQPSGPRFKVDEKNKYVEWMGFTFYLTWTRDTGMRLYDIKFKGQRILYELGLQEAIAHYAGNDPVQSGCSYMDTYYGFGPFAFSQVPGYDMPQYAYCMNATFHAAEISQTHQCAISIFEADQNSPLQRHATDSYISVTKNIALTVRSISTIGNYDYLFDYVFYLDGSIETIVRASGYIQTAFYAKNEEFGYRINQGLSGSMHDHVLTFKADFDILGTRNTLVKHTVEPIEKKFKWSDKPRKTMHLVKSEITNEDQGKMNWADNGKEQVIVVNKEARNPYGEPRGYRIMPSRGGAGMRLTMTNSSNLLNSAGFASHQYYVTRQKDSERRASSAWNDYDPGHPLVDFSKFFNSENLVQEDIVLWFNLGMHHVPHTGDLPNTVFTTAQSGMMITPHNYLTDDPSRQSTQQIRIDYPSDQVTRVHTFGAQKPAGVINLTGSDWDPYSYPGDVAVRKFPYDPQDPFTEYSHIVKKDVSKGYPLETGGKEDWTGLGWMTFELPETSQEADPVVAYLSTCQYQSCSISPPHTVTPFTPSHLMVSICAEHRQRMITCIPPHLRDEVCGSRTRSAGAPEPVESASTPVAGTPELVNRTEAPPAYDEKRSISSCAPRRDASRKGTDGLPTPVTQGSSSNRGSSYWPFNRAQTIAILLLLVHVYTYIRWTPHFGPPSPLAPAPLEAAFVERCHSLLPPPAGIYNTRLDTLAQILPDDTVYIAEPSPTSYYYLGGFSTQDWWLSERPFLIAIASNGNVTLLTPAFEAARAKLIDLLEEVSERVEWLEWKENESPFQVLAEHLKAKDVHSFVLDGEARQLVAHGLRAVIEEKAGQLERKVAEVRERKSKREVDLLRCANQFTLHAIRSTRARMHIGITESQTSQILEEEMSKTGLIGGEGLVLFGENAALPHGSGTDRVLGEKDMILIDAGGKWGGYVSDITRTFALPESHIPSDHVELWETVRRAQLAPYTFLSSLNGSSLKAGDLDAVARAVVTRWQRQGHDSAGGSEEPDLSIFTHRLGHGIGLQGHESPYLVQGPQGDRELKGGNVFSLEPGIYLPADGRKVRGMNGVGVRLEDCFALTGQGEQGWTGEWLSGPVTAWGHV